MNKGHREFLGSPAWAAFLETELLPWVLSLGDLGDDVLEIGPGPGLTTDLLRRYARRVTAVELDEELATALAERLAGTNVDVISADATASGLPSDRFTSVASFSMFHHIPDAATQDRVFAEVFRVLRPGGRLVAVDSRDNEAIRGFHQEDVFVPLDPDRLGDRLGAAGFVGVEATTSDFEVRFSATKP